MLNRTNRTLSANLNRLNLGTRSFAIAANVNNGDQTLRLRHDDHRVVLRDGMPGYPTTPISIRSGGIPAIPSSSPSTSSRQVLRREVGRPRVELAVVSFPERGSACLLAESQERFLGLFWQKQEDAKRDRKPLKTGLRSLEGYGLGRTSAQATLATPATAILAAAGG
ncbi:hypothetical protein ACYOEI_12220 [Singulisphaera rosea]